MADPSDPSNVTCAGLTGAIDKITDGRLQRMTDGFISVSGPGGIAAGGPAAVSVSDGRIVAIMAGNTVGVPTGGLPANILAAARGQLGRLVNVGPGDQLHPAARVGDTDFRWAQHHKNLNPQFPDSNPNGVALEHGTAYVVDAGSNTLDVVTSDGRILVLTYFGVPSGSPTDSVPTCVAKGPDGALYVGELLGGQFAPGHARVWRVTISNGVVHKSIWAGGLTAIQGCGFDHAGNFYATEFQVNGLSESAQGSPLGAVVKIARNGARSTIGTGRLLFPSGFAAGSDGAVYVSNCSIAPSRGFGPCPNGGQVMRIKS